MLLGEEALTKRLARSVCRSIQCAPGPPVAGAVDERVPRGSELGVSGPGPAQCPHLCLPLVYRLALELVAPVVIAPHAQPLLLLPAHDHARRLNRVPSGHLLSDRFRTAREPHEQEPMRGIEEQPRVPVLLIDPLLLGLVPLAGIDDRSHRLREAQFTSSVLCRVHSYGDGQRQPEPRGSVRCVHVAYLEVGEATEVEAESCITQSLAAPACPWLAPSSSAWGRRTGSSCRSTARCGASPHR